MVIDFNDFPLILYILLGGDQVRNVHELIVIL